MTDPTSISLLCRSLGAAPTDRPLISVVLSTYNRCPVLLGTLARLRELGDIAGRMEILVVDNASRDGTAEAVRRGFPQVKLFALQHNGGACAKNVALPAARGEFVVFLDDDSCPLPGSLERMVEHFRRDGRLGAAVFTVNLPDGSRECSAYPEVFIGCGTGLRRSALDEVGHLPKDFFMQAEEYDLSLRLLEAGWEVRAFDDLHVLHLKTPTARVSARTMRLDVRNNLVLAVRYFPLRWLVPYGWDWMRRYWAIADSKNQRGAYLRGLLEGMCRAMRPGHRRPVSSETFEQFAKLEETHRLMMNARKQLGLRNILLVDYGKNLPAYWRAARACGLRVVAIADARLANRRRRYHGVPIVDDATARRMIYDAAIVSNLSPVHARRRCAQWRALDARPVMDLFVPERDHQEQVSHAYA